MDTTAAPQIIEHLSKSIAFTPFDTKWIPGTAKFVLMGQSTRATGLLQVHQLDKKELKLVSDMDKGKGYKCGTFGATIGSSEIALGEFSGDLTIWDIEKNGTVYNIKAHDGIVNCIDGIGGQNIGAGAPEIVTGGRDGCVRIWDKRQKGPVVSLEPVEKEPAIPDCWCVAFGNAYNNEERVVVAGYDNGDIKLFDLRMNQLRWDTNVKNGVCGIEFDRKDILMNKLVATTLESKVNVFDMRTHHVELGYSSLTETAQKSTIWGVKHLPQNRDIFATLGGNGALNLYKYNYPSQRAIQDVEGKMKGVVGTLELINSKDVAQQPVASLDWHSDKLGLAVMSGLDQTVKVLIVTKLNLY